MRVNVCASSVPITCTMRALLYGIVDGNSTWYCVCPFNALRISNWPDIEKILITRSPALVVVTKKVCPVAGLGYRRMLPAVAAGAMVTELMAE